MCWKTRKVECLEAQVADKLLTTFKVLVKKGKSLYSYYRPDYHWREAEVNSLEGELAPVKCVEGIYDYIGYIEKGFHSYSPDEVYLRKDHREIEIASPSYYILDWFILSEARQLVLAKCEIPKGATYYRNEDGEIVSDKIVVEEAMPLEDYIFDPETQARWGMRLED